MEESIYLLMDFMIVNGWQLALIALIGIILLGVLKYCNVFDGIPKEKRKIVYFTITIGFSLLASLGYLLIVDNFTIDYIITITTAIYGLNQTFYTIYENTSLRDLVIKVLELIEGKLRNKNQ